MITKICDNCGKEVLLYPSRANKSIIIFCNKSCHRSYKNKLANPSWERDLKGKNNPMFGRHPKAWNKGLINDECHNWKGGLHKRKDGYYRIQKDGKRYLYHRFILKDKIKDTDVIHHKDNNPSNNSLSNLQIFSNQCEHIKIGHNDSHTLPKNNS